MRAGLYQNLLLAFADDLEAGGVVAEICRDWLDAPSGAVVQLRLLAGLHRLALERRAPELAHYYPNLGGGADPAGAWAVFESVMRQHVDELREALLIAPQTNEPGRSVPLLVGLFDAVARSGLSHVRLLEVGASAGLNLLVDRFRIGGGGWSSGPADSPLQLLSAVIGPVSPADYTVISRRGCDLAPVDPTSQEGRLRLTSFVWPHDLHRHERLRAALQVAAAHPVTVDRAAAADWLADQLSEPAGDGVLTVLWHSITRQYWPAVEVAAVDRLVVEAGTRLPIAQISMENPGSDGDRRTSVPAELTVRLLVPGGPSDPASRLLAYVDDHGVPVTMLR
jgi:hypothetical protein